MADFGTSPGLLLAASQQYLYLAGTAPLDSTATKKCAVDGKSWQKQMQTRGG